MAKTLFTWLITVFTITLMALGRNAFATDLPGAGAQIQQIPPVPISQKATPTMPIKPGSMTVTPVSDGVSIRVRLLRITGQTLYSEAELLALTGFSSDSELTLSELRVMASNIYIFYHRKGYFAAHAFIPAQDIKDGVVNISVIEGRYGAITLHNGTNLSNNLANTLLAGVKSGDVIASDPLEDNLLLLSDLPGVEVTSTLVPSTTIGASDLIVDIAPGSRVTGSVDADNAGNRYTGKYRIGTTVNLNNAAGIGDVASLRALTSGSGMYYVRAAYQIQTGKAKMGIAYSILGYELGEEFKPLKANGTAQIMSIYGSYPLIRTRNTNLYAQLTIDNKTFQDSIDSTATTTDKTALVLMSSLHGNHRDTFGGGGQSTGSLTWTAGSIAIQTPAAYNFDAVTAKNNGPFNKIGYTASRLQSVTKSISLNASINGQLAFKNLDVSEKMELGGMYAVRAYPEGETYADEGYVLNLEARLELPKLSEYQPSQMHLIGFFDTGTVTINRNPWTAEPNHRTLSGAGIGITWQEYNNFSVKAYYAQKIGNEAAKSGPDSSGQFWIQLVKYYYSAGNVSNL